MSLRKKRTERLKSCQIYIYMYIFFQKATVTWILIYGEKMKPSAEKLLVSLKAITCCCDLFHIAHRWLKRGHAESSEETTALVGLHISQIMNVVVSCKTSKSQKKMCKGLPFMLFIHGNMKLVLLIVFFYSYWILSMACSAALKFSLVLVLHVFIVVVVRLYVCSA